MKLLIFSRLDASFRSKWQNSQNYVAGGLQATRSEQSKFKQAKGLPVVSQVRTQAKQQDCFDNLFSE